MTKLFRPGVLTLATILAVFPRPASAQTDEERAGARAAGLAGLEAFEAGKYEQAADYFGRAERLMHAPTHLLYLGRANLKLGHLVSAREFYLKLTQERLPGTASKPFRDAQAAGDKELAELEPRLPYVSVVVQGAGAKDVQVSRDGERVPQPLIGVPHPVDPGEHTFRAVAEGMESAPSTILLKEGSRETVVLTLSASATAPAPAAGSSAPASGGSVGFGADTGGDTSPSTGGTSGLRIGAYIGMGVGVVGLGLGTYFLVKGSKDNNDSDTLYAACVAAKDCPGAKGDKVNSLLSDAARERTIGAVAMIGGGVALATGVTLLVVDLSSGKKAASEPRLQPILGLNFAGVRGSF